MLNSEFKFRHQVKSTDVRSSISKHQIGDGMQLVLDNDNSGKYIVDKATGKKYLDFFTCFASMPLGFNHPKMLERSFLDYLSIHAVNKPSNSDLYSEVQATFTNTLFHIGVPSNDFKYSFYIEGGALAVENALKAAIDWKIRKNLQKGLSENLGTKVLHFKQAFHGRSGYTLSLTNTDPVKVQYFPKFDWPRVDNPKIVFPIETHIEDLISRENESIRQIEQAFHDNSDDIACIIIEPIQGEGGDNHFRDEFFVQLREICDKYEAMLIFDEVQTGVGLTGKMWAYQHLSIKPDILCFGKKMQVCGILCNERIDEVEDNVFKKSSRINSTWGGNYTDMVRATRYLEIIEEENLVANAELMGEFLHSKLLDLQDKYDTIISNVRGKGLFRAFDIAEEKRKPFIDKCYENGLIILACGKNSIRFRTRLNVRTYELEEGISIVDKSLQAIL
jgi:L-lysine 6-transaminase